jgi:hypothetical protein
MLMIREGEGGKERKRKRKRERGRERERGRRESDGERRGREERPLLTSSLRHATLPFFLKFTCSMRIHEFVQRKHIRVTRLHGTCAVRCGPCRPRWHVHAKGLINVVDDALGI